MFAAARNKLSACVLATVIIGSSSSGIAQEPMDKEFWLEQKKFAADEFFREMKAPDENTLRLRNVFIWVSSLIGRPESMCYEANMLTEIDSNLSEIERITEIARNNMEANPSAVTGFHKERIQDILKDLEFKLNRSKNLEEKISIANKINELTRAEIAYQNWLLRTMPQRQIIDMAGKARVALTDVRKKVDRANSSEACRPTPLGCCGTRG